MSEEQHPNDSTSQPADHASGEESLDERSLLTAYALGELDDGQRAEIEARLRESADDRQAVDDLVRLGKLLRTVAAQPPLTSSPLTQDSLTDRSPVLRQAVLAQLADAPQSQAPLRLPERPPRRRFWLPLSLAASLAVTCGTLFALIKTKHGEQVAARPDTLDRTQPAGTSGLGDAVGELGMETADPAGLGPMVTFGDELTGRVSNGMATSRDTGLELSDLALPAEPGEVARRSAGGSAPSAALGGRMGRTEARSGSGGPGDRPTSPAPASEPDGSGLRAGLGTAPYQPPHDGSRYAAEGRGDQSGEKGEKAGDADDTAVDYFLPTIGAKRPYRGRGDAGEQDGERKDRGGYDQGRLDARNKGSRSYFFEGTPAQDSKSNSTQQNGTGQKGEEQPEQEGGDKSGGGQRSNRELDGLGEAGQPGNSEGWFRKGLPPGGMMGGGAMRGAMGGGMKAGGMGGADPSAMARAPQQGVEAYTGYGAIALQNAESYPTLVENLFRKSTEHPLSTFSIDVDTASYTNVRRFLNSRAMPPRDAVRVEELINYFQYHYPQPDGDVPFSVTTDVADCPWQAQHRLLRIGLKGREIPADERPAGNLVFLLDVSGSMDAPNKLPLVKEAMYLLVDKLTENDRVAIVVYAGNSGLVLPPTNGQNKETIRAAISQLVASGSTNGGQGLQMAYDTALAHFIKGGTNRVILATDGDFNVGVVDQNDLVRLIEEKAKSGVFLSALGFGIGNLKDGTLEKLADKGNGNYAYIDTLGEARRVLVEQLSGTLVTIAKDVKLQIEFNPAQAAEYRLIGYEDRLMPQQDFHDDRKDAGEIGAGHSVTALYEIVPAATVFGKEAGVEPLKYQRSENANPNFTAAAATGELATIKLRYKEPDGQQSRLIERAVADRRPQRAEASRDMNFAAAVAAFGMLLRDSPYRGEASYQQVLSLAEQGLSGDPNGYRSEFVQLVRQAREISGKE
ncbi:MAG TPA: von Willebrand factor type A domain-containing protein [Pirellulales bacterium]|jgi:Ca-activated chloride channel family protein|nr:von Willebrand factor type A domain-containing protein [Pirellulales bacterium]